MATTPRDTLDLTRSSISDRTSFWARTSSIMSDDTLAPRESDDLPVYDDATIFPYEKHLPLIPPKEKSKFRLSKVTPPAPQYHSIPSPVPLTPVAQLTNVLGTDNVNHTTEIDSVPCAGIAVPNGPLEGLLAWRLVVRSLPESKIVRNATPPPSARSRLHGTSTPPLVTPFSLQAQPFSESTERLEPPPPVLGVYNHTLPLRASTHSLPSYTLPPRSGSPLPSPSPKFGTVSFVDLPRKSRGHQPSASFSHSPSRPSFSAYPKFAPSFDSPYTSPYPSSPSELSSSSPTTAPTSKPDAIVVNFLLDTSARHSTITRDALIALGFPPHTIPFFNAPPPPPRSSSLPLTTPTPSSISTYNNSHNTRESWSVDRPNSPSTPARSSTPPLVQIQGQGKPVTITLSVQGIPTLFHIAEQNQPSRLGVQFLRDAGVSVFYPRTADVPILYLESDLDTHKIPATIPKPSTKVSLAQRVRILFGFADKHAS